MPRTRRTAKAAAGPALPDALLHSLENRLDLLIRTLNEAEISGKGMDIVKEIKELHSILQSRQNARADSRPQRLVVVWGQPEGTASA